MTLSLLLLAEFFIVSLALLLPASLVSVKVKYSLLLFTVALLFAVGALHLNAVLMLAVLALLMAVAAAQRYARPLRFMAGAVATAGIFMITLAKPAGFIVTPVVENIFLSHASLPFTFKISYAKGMVGLFILLFWLPMDADFSTIKNKLRLAVVPCLCSVVLLMGLLLLLGYSVDGKWYWFSPYFLMANLCLTVIAEEVFFRGIMQRKLLQVLTPYTQYAGLLALVTGALFFAVVHIKGGAAYAALAGLAGLLYGWIYWRYQSIHAAILCHFGVNFVHFTLLKYPG